MKKWNLFVLDNEVFAFVKGCRQDLVDDKEEVDVGEEEEVNEVAVDFQVLLYKVRRWPELSSF